MGNASGFLFPGEYTWNLTTASTVSLFSSFSCSSYATESSLSQCTLSSTSSSSCATSCLNPKAIKCHSKLKQIHMLLHNNIHDVLQIQTGVQMVK